MTNHSFGTLISSDTLKEYGVTLSLLLAALLAIFYPIIFQDRMPLPSDMIDSMTLPFSGQYGPPHAFNSLVSDGSLQFYPLKYLTAQALRHGIFAFWDPYILNGYPQYLEGMWVYNFLLFLPMRAGFLLLLMAPLLVAGFGFYLLLRDYRVRPGVARIFALAYMLNGLFVTHLLAYFIPSSFSFAPFVLLYLHRYKDRPQFKYLAFAAISLALGFMAGNLQTVGFLLIMTAIYWISLSLIGTRPRQNVWKPIIITFAFAIGLSMMMLLPTSELFYQVLHSGHLYPTSLVRSYSLLQRAESALLTLTFFVPQLSGSIRGVTVHQTIGVYRIDFEGAIGFLPLVLASWASITMWRKNPEVRPFVTLMAAGLVLPIASPFFRLLYHRFFVVFVFGACGAGAFGLEEVLSNEQLRDNLSNWLRKISFLLVSLFAVLVFWTITLHFQYEKIHAYASQHLLPKLESASFAEGNPAWAVSRLNESLDYWRITRPEIIFCFATCLLAIVVLRWFLKRPEGRVGWMLTVAWLVTAVQLILFARLWLPMPDEHRYPAYPPSQLTAQLQSMHGEYSTLFYREFLPGKQYMFVNNENIVYGIREPRGYESVVPRCLLNMIGLVTSVDSVRSNSLAKFNIGMLVSQRPLAADTGIELLSSDEEWVYRVRAPGPRAFLTHFATRDTSEIATLLDVLNEKRVWPAAYFPPDETADRMEDQPDASDSVSLVSEDGNELSVHTRSSRGSYLIVTDTYYPGWTCEVDGKTAEVLRCNYCMRAIRLQPGAHRVEMRFRPLTLRAGCWVSGLTLLLIVGMIVRDRARIRANQPSFSIASTGGRRRP